MSSTSTPHAGWDSPNTTCSDPEDSYLDVQSQLDELRPLAHSPQPADEEVEEAENAPKQGLNTAKSLPNPNDLEDGIAEMKASTHPLTLQQSLGQSFGQSFTPIANDATDFSNHYFSNTDYLCSKCQEVSWKLSTPNQTANRAWHTTLKRVILHRHQCRLCTLLLESLCQPHNDPFKHPQIRDHLGERKKDFTDDRRNWPAIGERDFRTWLDVWSKKSFRLNGWPFGYGATTRQDIHGSFDGATRAFGRYSRNVIDSGILGPGAIAAAKLVPKRLPCQFTVDIDAPKGLLDIKLWGYGRGHKAENSVISHFRLSTEGLPGADTAASPRNGLRYRKASDKGQIALETSSMWLDDCLHNHGHQCSEQGWQFVLRPPDFIRLIDVEDHCLVEFSGPSTAAVQYVALSYVWGPKDHFRLKKEYMKAMLQKAGLDRFLEHDIPQTLKDAMTATRSSGLRYLWIDFLCIQQDDEHEKNAHMAAMDRIFGNALVTIIAADSADADKGLRGVQKDTRTVEQQIGHLAQDQRLIGHLPIPRGLEESIWNSRAWTLQERLLSRRLLIFIDGQMMWRCRQAVHFEDVGATDKAGEIEPFDWLSIKPQYVGHNARRGYIDGSISKLRDGRTVLVRSGAFTEYVKIVEHYTHRQITYSADILKALAGILGILEQCFHCRMSYGLPHTLLDVAILWRPRERLRRRPLNEINIPSWSWAGWVGRVGYDETFSEGEGENGIMKPIPEHFGEERIRSLVRWYSLDGDVLQPINGNGLGIPLPIGLNDPLPVEWDQIPAGVESLKSLQHLNLSNDMMQLLNSRELLFKTSCSCSFQFGRRISYGETATAECPSFQYKLKSNAGGENAGIITLDGDGPSELVEGKHALVVLSEAEYLGYGEETLRRYDNKNADFPLYNVMLIEWAERKPIASRLGLGRVSEPVWRKSQTTVETIILT